jgi:Spy/CpxP family protein refolding chaperone
VKTKIQQFEKIRAEAASVMPTAAPAMCMSTSSMVSNGGISRVRASFLAAHGGGCGDPNNSKQQQQQMLANSSQQQSQQHLMQQQQPKVIEDFHSNVKVKELRCMFEVSSAAPPPVSS